MAGRILIADPTSTNRILLKVRLGTAHYDTIQAQTGAEAIERARRDRPDLIVLDAHLSGDGAAICARLKADPATRAIPVLVVDGNPSRAARLAALRAGADDYLEKSPNEAGLLALVRNLMRARATIDELGRRQDTEAYLGFAETTGGFARPARVALLAPTPETGLAWRRQLDISLPARTTTMTRSAALDAMPARSAPDAFVIAADLASHGDGISLVSELRSRSATRHAVIVILDEAAAPARVPIALDIGANAVVSGRFDAEEIAARLDTLLSRKLETDALRESFDHRLSLAARDPLTGLYNRRYAETYLTRVAAEAAGTGQPFALMLLDLDRFKSVNDTHGHRVGDEVLIETAARLRANVRDIDLLARYGGEEFVIAMPETDLSAASSAAERLRRVIGDTPMHAPSQGKEVAVTVSIGVALCPGDAACDPGPLSLIERADTALYASKTDGRNLVTFAAGCAA